MAVFTLHYPAMFFLLGQVVLGYVLNCKRNILPTKSGKNLIKRDRGIIA